MFINTGTPIMSFQAVKALAYRILQGIPLSPSEQSALRQALLSDDNSQRAHLLLEALGLDATI